MRITAHFNSGEFRCKNVAETPYPEKWLLPRLKPLCEALEKIRCRTGGFSIHILSGYRTAQHNKSIGGAEKSQHLNGRAADISSRKVSPRKLHRIIKKLIKCGEIPDGGLAKYSSWIHYDQRGYKARW